MDKNTNAEKVPRSGGTNFSKIGIYYLIGTFFQKGIAFLTVPVFTRIMGTDDYGLINTYNSWLTIVSMFISAALYMSLRLAFVDYRDDVENFLASITTFAILDGVAFCVGAVIIELIFGSSTFVFLAIICILQAIGDAILTDLTQYYVMQYRYRIRTALMILPQLISAILAVIVILLLQENKYLGRIVPTAIVSTVFGIVTAINIYRKSTVPLKKEYIVYGLKISAPLILHGIALNILGSSDRIMITSIRNSAETGIYSLVYNVGMIATALTTALDGIWTPWFIHQMDGRISDNGEEQRNASTDKINSAFSAYLYAMTIIMIVITLIGPEIVRVLADKRYWDGISIIPPIVLANYMIFVYTFYVSVEHFYKKTFFISINTLIAAGTNIILNFIFIPQYGYAAAAYTTFTSYVVSLILHMIKSRGLDRDLFDWKKVLPPLVFVATSVVLFYVVIDMFVVRWLVAIICMWHLVIKHRDKIAGYFKKR